MKAKEAVVWRLKDLVQMKGITINHLATLSATPPTTVKNIIYGNTNNPGIVTIAKLCDGLGISIYEFFNSDIFYNLEQEIE